MGRPKVEKKIWLDAAGKKRRLTHLQERIIAYRLDHPEMLLSQIARELKCSYQAVVQAVKNPWCQEREDELRGQVDKTRVASLQERQEKLTQIIRAKVTDYFDENGKVKVTKESPNQEAIAEYNVVITKRGEQVKFRLHSIIEAIAALDREEGIGRVPVVNDQRSINITHVTVVEHPQVGGGERKGGWSSREGGVLAEGEKVEVREEGSEEPLGDKEVTKGG